MSNSSLITYTNISPNRNSPRNHDIDTITIHCIVGQCSAKAGCDWFAQSAAKASANYVVGKDGDIGLSVDEGDRSWCSSSPANDNRAVTIEVASDTTEPYAVTDAAYNALITLVADICGRNGIGRLIWSTDKNTRVNHLNGANMTVHRDYANKSCPGEYLYSRHGDIAERVNAILNRNENNNNESEVIEMTGEEIYRKLREYLEGQSVPNWAKDEFEKSIAAGITDGANPMGLTPRYQAAIMSLRAKNGGEKNA